MAFAAIRLEARACRVPLSRFPGPLVRRVHLDRRELDAAGRAVLARLRADALLVLSRARLFLRAAPDPPPHADRRRRRRPARSAARAARIAAGADGDGIHARRASLSAR